MESDEYDETNLIDEPSNTQDELSTLTIKTYKRRFWVLLILSLLSFFQCVLWNTWGPISESAIKVLESWSPKTVAMMSNLGTLAFFIFVIPACYYVKLKGLRSGALLCAFLLAVGTILRCSTTKAYLFTACCYISALMFGAAGTALQIAPPLLAAGWFPSNERTTATAFCQALNQLGNAGSYLEPLFVPSPSEATDKQIFLRIQLLMLIGAIIASILFFATLAYFPSKPPTPPSLSSSIQRYEFIPTIKFLLRNKQVLLLTLSYSIFGGVPAAWMSVLNISLLAVGIQQNEAMKIGLIAILTSCGAAVLVGRLTDKFYGHIKFTLLVFVSITFSSFGWFYLLSMKLLPYSLWQVYASVIIGISFFYASVPLYFELTVETAYPSPEEVVGGALTAGNNLIGAIFLFLFLIPTKDYIWVTYCLLGSCILAFIPLLLFQEEYYRSTIDRRQEFNPSLSGSINNESQLRASESI